MILGVGVDLVEVARMRRALQTPWAQRLIRRIFSPEEIAVCEAASDPAQSYAARFAAKEALAKALGTGFTRGVSPGLIVVAGGERIQPRIVLRDQALEIARSMKVSSVHVSLSHSRETACAMVVVE